MAPTKMTARTFLEAAEDRYGDEMDDSAHLFGIRVTVHAAPQASGSAQTDDLDLPASTNVRDEDITHAGDEQTLARVCARVRSLDLSSNALADWKEVLKITSSTLRLQSLDVSNNPLSASSLRGLPPHHFRFLLSLALNSCCLSWPALHAILLSAPQVRELQLNTNAFHTVEFPEDFEHGLVTRLLFCGNELLGPEHMLRLGHAFPGLTHLYLSECGLKTLGADWELALAFPELIFLNLSMARLKDWSEIEKLSGPPKLTNLFVQGIPFLEMMAEELRHCLLVAWLPKVTRLNSYPVDDYSRCESEKLFLQFYQGEEEKSTRYTQLVALHGEPTEAAPRYPVPKSLFSLLLEAVDREERPMELNILEVQTVRQLKLFLERKDLVGFPARKMRLHLLHQHDWAWEEELNIPERTLRSLELADGDKFLVDRKPL